MSNLISNNLVSDSRSVGWSDRIDHENDVYPAAFLNWYSPNHYFNNIAVASNRYGFRFDNNWQSRLEDGSSGPGVRNLRIGDFDGNVARSCNYEGMYFSYHYSGGDLNNLKLIKNRVRGLYVMLQETLLSPQDFLLIICMTMSSYVGRIISKSISY